MLFLGKRKSGSIAADGGWMKVSSSKHQWLVLSYDWKDGADAVLYGFEAYPVARVVVQKGYT